MPMLARQGHVALLTGLLFLAGCQGSSVTPMRWLPEQPSVKTARAANMVLRVVDGLAAARASHYITVTDWHSATITLSRSGSTLGTRTVTPDSTKETAVSSANNAISFTSLEPGQGYVLDVTLKGYINGVEQTIATGSSNSLTLKAGSNAATVTLTLTGTKITPSISQPSSAPGGLAAVVGTGAPYQLQRLAGHTYAAAHWANGEDYDGGAGQAPDATIRRIAGIATDCDGNVYFADSTRNTIRKVRPDGSLVLVAGKGDNATPAESGDGEGVTAAGAAIGSPVGLILSPGPNAASSADDVLYFADPYHHKIKYVNALGKVLTFAGIGVDRAKELDPAASNDSTLCDIGMPAAMVMDDNGDIYYTTFGSDQDSGSTMTDDASRIWRIAADTGMVTQVYQLTGYDDEMVRALAIDRVNDRLYVRASGGGDTQALVIGGIASGSATLLGSIAFESYRNLSALDFDQYGNLYGLTSGTSQKVTTGSWTVPYNDKGVKAWRVPIDTTTGLMRAGHHMVRIAGDGDETPVEPNPPSFAPFDAPVVAIPDATTQRLLGHSSLSLHVDPYRSASAGLPQRVLVGNGFFGSTFVAEPPDAWSQLIQLTAP